MASVGKLNCLTLYVQCVCSYVGVVRALYIGLCEQHLDVLVFLYNAIGSSQISLFLLLNRLMQKLLFTIYNLIWFMYVLVIYAQQTQNCIYPFNCKDVKYEDLVEYQDDVFMTCLNELLSTWIFRTPDVHVTAWEIISVLTDITISSGRSLSSRTRHYAV